MVAIKKTIEPGLTLFSAAEIRVALVTIGEMPEDLLANYVSLISRHRQVELVNVNSFYKPLGEQKTPFKYFPWRSGCLHFKYMMEEEALAPAPLSSLHMHRKVLGVIGLCHSPSVQDIRKEYQQFEHLCRGFPDAFTLRFFAFNPTDVQIEQDRKDMRNLIMFPPGDFSQLERHAEVLMHDFAACLLAELERWMLAASISLFDTSTYVDSAEFTGATAFDDFQSKLRQDDEMLRKRRYARLQKAQGDVALLAGSPRDAYDHYAASADLAKVSSDLIWLAGALEGRATSQLVQEAISRGAIRTSASTIFTGGSMRSSSRASLADTATSSAAAGSSAVGEGGEDGSPAARGEGEDHGDDGDDDSAGSCGGGSSSGSVSSSSGFSGEHFWQALRGAGVDEEIRSLLSEAKREVVRKRALPLQVELDLKLARFLIGLSPPNARTEVSDLVSGVVEAAGALGLPEDRLMAVVEAAQVIGGVGFGRKRTLMLWQAVELSKSMERPDASTLAIAKKALEPAGDVCEGGRDVPPLLPRRGICQASVPLHWGAVRTGCIEGVLALAIRARSHLEVWDCSAMLLREQHLQLSATRQTALVDTLSAAASHMGPSDKSRPGPGPPPLVYYVRVLQPAEQFKPVLLWERMVRKSSSKTPFIYDPWSDKRKQQAENDASRPVQWVCGEMATVELEAVNPTAVILKVDRLTVEAEHVGDGPRTAAAQDASPAANGDGTVTASTAGDGTAHVTASTNAWKPMPISLPLYPAEPGVAPRPKALQLSGAPTQKGLYVLAGCKVTMFGVTWLQPWAPKHATLGSALKMGRARLCGEGGSAPELAADPGTRVQVVKALPLLMASLDKQQWAMREGGTGGPGGVASPIASPPNSPPGSFTEAARPRARPSRRTVVYRGELLMWHVHVSNIGKHAVTAATMHVAGPAAQRGGRYGFGGFGSGSKASLTSAASAAAGHRTPGQASDVAVVEGTRVRAWQQQLEAALPLAPGMETLVPLQLHVAPTPPASADEQVGFDVVLEYVGPLTPTEQAAMDEGQGATGRRLRIPVNLRLAPGLHVSGVRFLEHYSLPSPPCPSSCCESGVGEGAAAVAEAAVAVAEAAVAGAEAAAGGAAGQQQQLPQRCCLMEVEVANYSGVPMEVAIVRRRSDELAGPPSTPPSAALKGGTEPATPGGSSAVEATAAVATPSGSSAQQDSGGDGGSDDEDGSFPTASVLPMRTARVFACIRLPPKPLDAEPGDGGGGSGGLHSRQQQYQQQQQRNQYQRPGTGGRYGEGGVEDHSTALARWCAEQVAERYAVGWTMHADQTLRSDADGGERRGLAFLEPRHVEAALDPAAITLLQPCDLELGVLSLATLGGGIGSGKQPRQLLLALLPPEQRAAAAAAMAAAGPHAPPPPPPQQQQHKPPAPGGGLSRLVSSPSTSLKLHQHPGGGDGGGGGSLMLGDATLQLPRGPTVPPNALRGASVRAGEMLRCTLRADNRGPVPQRVRFSLSVSATMPAAVAGLDPAADPLQDAGGAGGGGAAGGPPEQQQVVVSGWQELNILAAGCVQGICLDVQPGQSATHDVALCCYAEGLYCLHAADVRCEPIPGPTDGQQQQQMAVVGAGSVEQQPKPQPSIAISSTFLAVLGGEHV